MKDPNDKNGRDNVFPPEYAHISKMVYEAEERIKQIDEQIKNVPKDKGPGLEYNPPGFLRPRQPGNRDQTIDKLEKQKAQIKADTFSKVEQETVREDPKKASVIRDNVREKLYPNPYKEMDRAKFLDIQKKEKDIEASQDFAGAQLKNSRVSSHTEKDVPEQSSSQPSQKEAKPLSMSERFSQSLGYTRATEKTENASDKSPSPRKDQDDKDRD